MGKPLHFREAGARSDLGITRTEDIRRSGIAERRSGRQIARMPGHFPVPWFDKASKRRLYLVGVSGGADSVALLHLLIENGFRRLVVCHLDHRLRGRQSTADATFVRKLAVGLGLTVESGRADVAADLRSGGASLETAARAARHRFFAECAKRHRCPRVLLAHHADDQAETVLWNLLRGSRGARGMRVSQTITVEGKRLELLRPLLGCRHADLVAWLRERSLPWREDPTNAQPIAIRNRLRNEVFPLLEEISGRDPVPALVRAAGDMQAIDDLERELVDAARLMDPQGRLHVPALRTLPLLLRRTAVRDFLADRGVGSLDRALLDRCVALADDGSPAVVNLAAGRRLRRTAGRLWIDG